MKLVILDGVLNSSHHASNQDEWTFMLDLARGNHIHWSSIKDVKVGNDIAGQRDASGKRSPDVKARWLTCEHITKKVTNFSVFFRWITKPNGGQPGQIRVIGLGKHGKKGAGGGQTSYIVQWSDGSSSPIELTHTISDKNKAGRSEFLANFVEQAPR